MRAGLIMNCPISKDRILIDDCVQCDYFDGFSTFVPVLCSLNWDLEDEIGSLERIEKEEL